MWMNLDALPAGKSMYTVYVTTDPEGTPRSEMGADAVDIVASSSATWGSVCSYGTAHPSGEHAPTYIIGLYGEDARIIGVVNQSDAYVVYDAFLEGDETGAS